MSLKTTSRIDIYNTHGAFTWNKYLGAKWVHVTVIGAGSGGGSGGLAVNNVTQISAGQNPAGVAVNQWGFPAAMLGDTETVTVGQGGAGKAGETVAGTNGGAGGQGGTSSFGNWLISTGGKLSFGNVPLAAMYSPTNAAANAGLGLNSSATGATSAQGGSGTGGTGGQIQTGGALQVPTAGGSSGGSPGTYRNILVPGGIIGAPNGGNGGTVNGTSDVFGGGGGGGGVASVLGNAGNGGNGGFPGGSGGSGGCAVSGIGTAGNGGNGADGIVIVQTFF